MSCGRSRSARIRYRADPDRAAPYREPDPGDRQNAAHEDCVSTGEGGEIFERPGSWDADERDEDDQHQSDDAGSPSAHEDEDGWPQEVELLLDGQAPGVPEQPHRGAGGLDPIRDVEKRGSDAEGDGRPSTDKVDRKDEDDEDQQRRPETAHAATVERPEVDVPGLIALSEQQSGDEPSGQHEEDSDPDVAAVVGERQLCVAQDDEADGDRSEPVEIGPICQARRCLRRCGGRERLRGAHVDAPPERVRDVFPEARSASSTSCPSSAPVSGAPASGRAAPNGSRGSGMRRAIGPQPTIEHGHPIATRRSGRHAL